MRKGLKKSAILGISHLVCRSCFKLQIFVFVRILYNIVKP